MLTGCSLKAEVSQPYNLTSQVSHTLPMLYPPSKHSAPWKALQWQAPHWQTQPPKQNMSPLVGPFPILSNSSHVLCCLSEHSSRVRGLHLSVDVFSVQNLFSPFLSTSYSALLHSAHCLLSLVWQSEMGQGGIGNKFPPWLPSPTMLPQVHLTGMEAPDVGMLRQIHLNPLCNTDILFQIAGPKLQWPKASLAQYSFHDPSDELCSSVSSVWSTGSCTHRRPPASSRLLSAMKNHCGDFRKKNILKWCCPTALQEKTGVVRWGHRGWLTNSL